MNASLGLRYSEVFTLIAHHATHAADLAMKNPVADPGQSFHDHIARIEALTSYVAAAFEETP